MPPIKQPAIIQHSATTLAKKIRHKEVTSQAVIEAFIERIRDVNPLLNAVVEDRFDAAVLEAKQVDKFLSETDKSAEQIEKDTPLLGVPVTIKESCSLGGMSFSVGTKLRSGIRAETDGLAVVNIKNAGAIPLLISNTPEICASVETYNKITGYTANPYSQHRSAGGSSGGEGALISSAASALGIGSDFGGSIRVPCLFNGIFGHKPTPGIIPTKGHFPWLDDKEFLKMITIGPMSRFAEDLELGIKALAGSSVDILNLDKQVNINELKVYYMTDFGFTLSALPVDGTIKKCIRESAQHFSEAHGCTVEKIHLKDLEDAFEIGIIQLFEVEGGDQIVNLKGENDSSAYVELLKLLCNKSDYGSSVVMLKMMMKNAMFIPLSKRDKYIEKRDNLVKTITELLGDNGVIFMPTFTQCSHFKHQLVWKISSVIYPMIINVLGLPATHVPIGLNKSKLPVGFQVAAAPNQDRLCLAVAKELERKYGGWILPPCSELQS